ncbi:MAG: hypothetical protein ACKVOO_04645 [Burkholderiaceae bacterium]
MAAPNSFSQRQRSIPVQQAALESPTLARLMALAEESGQRLDAIRPLIPASLQQQVAAGPIDGPLWCLLVHNSAAAAKLRQLLPSLLIRLQEGGWQITAIRLKIQTLALPQPVQHG